MEELKKKVGFSFWEKYDETHKSYVLQQAGYRERCGKGADETSG